MIYDWKFETFSDIFPKHTKFRAISWFISVIKFINLTLNHKFAEDSKVLSSILIEIFAKNQCDPF